MDMQREIKANQTGRGSGPGGRSSDTPVAKDGGQDTGVGMRGGKDSICAARRAGVQSICGCPIHTAQRKEESTVCQRHHSATPGTAEISQQNGLYCDDGRPELRAAVQRGKLHGTMVHDTEER